MIRDRSVWPANSRVYSDLLPARRYASAALQSYPCVCLSFPSRFSIRTFGTLNGSSWFLARWHPLTYHMLYFKEIWVSPKIRKLCLKLWTNKIWPLHVNRRRFVILARQRPACQVDRHRSTKMAILVTVDAFSKFRAAYNKCIKSCLVMQCLVRRVTTAPSPLCIILVFYLQVIARCHAVGSFSGLLRLLCGNFIFYAFSILVCCQLLLFYGLRSEINADDDETASVYNTDRPTISVSL